MQLQLRTTILNTSPHPLTQSDNHSVARPGKCHHLFALDTVITLVQDGKVCGSVKKKELQCLIGLNVFVQNQKHSKAVSSPTRMKIYIYINTIYIYIYGAVGYHRKMKE